MSDIHRCLQKLQTLNHNSSWSRHPSRGICRPSALCSFPLRQKKKKRRLVKTVGLQSVLRTDAFIINTSVLEGKLQLGYTSKYPFRFSFVSLSLPPPPHMLHEANLSSDSRSTTVFWDWCDCEGFSNENKEAKNDGGSTAGRRWQAARAEAFHTSTSSVQQRQSRPTLIRVERQREWT